MHLPRALIFLSLPLALATATFAQARLELQPQRFSSASGEFELLVDPVTPARKDPANYTLSRNGEVLWRREHAVTLRDVAVSDDGRTIGYGYAKPEVPWALGKELRILILDPAGELLLDEVHERERSRIVCSTGSSPNGIGVFLQPAIGRGIVRACDERTCGEMWYSYDLETGKPEQRWLVRDEMPRNESLRGVMQLVELAQHDLVLLQWYLAETFRSPKMSRLGSRLVLVNSELECLWSLELPEDYSLDDRDAQSRLIYEIRKGREISDITEDGSFSLRMRAENLRVRFQIEVSDDGAVVVRETGRSPFIEAPDVALPTEPRPEAPAIQLEEITRVRFGPTEPRKLNPIRSIVAFEHLNSEGLRFVRADDSFVHVDTNGTVLSEVKFEVPGSNEVPQTHWTKLAGGDWLVTKSRYGEGERSRAYRVQPESGHVQALEGFDCPSPQKLESTPDGGFVVLANTSGDYSGTPRLYRFDPEGALLWTIDSSDPKDSAGLFYPADVAVLSDGSVVILEGIMNELRVFTAGGEFASVVDLEVSLGKKPNYLSSLSAAPDGQILVRDFGGDPEIVVLDRNGELVRSFNVTDPEHATAGHLQDHCQLFSNGSTWTTDGHLLVRISSDGLLQRILGAETDDHQLRRPNMFAIDAQGRLIFRDRRTAGVHVFDQTGRQLMVSKVAPDDADNRSSIDDMLSSGDGTIYMGLDDHGLRFNRVAPDGKRMPVVEFAAHKPVFVPGTNRYWGIHESSIVLTDEHGSTIRTIERRPDRRFWGDVALGAGASGHLAVLDEGTLFVYGPDGKLVHELEIPGRKDFGRDLSVFYPWVSISRWYPDVLLCDLRSETVIRSTLQGAEKAGRGNWRSRLSPDGEELWRICSKRPTLFRYALP